MEKMKILAVDDNATNLATIEQELKTKYEVISVISGRRAMKVLYKENVDLILLDVQMPVMDGIETLRQIRGLESGQTVPVIFLTAMKDKNTVIEGSKLGIMDYITKPFDAKDLQERIESVFKRLGKLPMSDLELHKRILDILKDVQESRYTVAIKKMDEVLGCQIDSEICERIRHARARLLENDIERTEVMIHRVLKVLATKLGSFSKEEKLPISQGELNARLLYVLDHIENFRVKEALKKLDDLNAYAVPDYVDEKIKDIRYQLKDYNDEEAEELVQQLLNDLQNGKIEYK